MLSVRKDFQEHCAGEFPCREEWARPVRGVDGGGAYPFLCVGYGGSWAYDRPVAQIKPLTEEEKKQKLAELREKMAAKRAAKAKEEAKEHLANEAIRRKSGKVCHTNSFSPHAYTNPLSRI